MTAVTKKPTWVGIAGIIGLLWNALVLVQVLGSFGRTEADFVSQGSTAAAAEALAAVPLWAELGFALGAVAGIAGCIQIARRHRAAVPVLVVSLVGYALLVLGNLVVGVFAETGTGHVVVNLLLLAIAAGLVAAAMIGVRRRILT